MRLTTHAPLTAALLAASVTLTMADGGHPCTLENYPDFAQYVNNPPFCAMPYASLDLNRVFAYYGATASQCGSCAQICGPAGCATAMLIDQSSLAPGHVDLSTGIGMQVVGDTTGKFEVDVTFVDHSQCHGIWNGQMFGSEVPSPGSPLEKLQSGANGVGGAVSAAAGGSSSDGTTSSSGAASPVVSDRSADSPSPSPAPVPADAGEPSTPAPSTTASEPVTNSSPAPSSVPTSGSSSSETYTLTRTLALVRNDVAQPTSAAKSVSTDNSTVAALDNSTTATTDSSTAAARDNSTTAATGNSTAMATGSSVAKIPSTAVPMNPVAAAGSNLTGYISKNYSGYENMSKYASVATTVTSGEVGRSVVALVAALAASLMVLEI